MVEYPRPFLATLIVLVAVIWPATVSAVGPSTKRSVAEANQKKQPERNTPPAREVDKATEASVLRLVQSHLPELKPVLQRLRSDDPRQYERAVLDLAKSARKLEIAKNRDERLYEIEVETLKAQNAVSLLTAKLKIRDDETDRKRLRKAIGRLQVAQLSRSQYEVDALKTRLRRTEQQLQNAQQRLETRRESTDQDFEKSYAAYLRRAGRKPESDSSETKTRAPNRRRSSGKPEAD